MPSENRLICPPTICVEKIRNSFFCCSYVTVKKKLAIETLA